MVSVTMETPSPNDPSETIDTDGDGVGNNADAFPGDPSETVDSDGDGYGDNADAFPQMPWIGVIAMGMGSETTETSSPMIL